MILIHKSWSDLKPNEESNGNFEWFNEYYDRIKNKIEFKDFPKEVLEQWIHPLHSNHQTIRNYAWMNYEFIGFELIEFEFQQLDELYVIEDFREYVDLRGNYSELNQFCCIDKDIEFWATNGTWRIPPIVLDTNSINSEIPNWSEISSRFQLVEGHSRLGYLKSIKRINELGNVHMAQKHKVYLMKVRKHNNVYKK
ncbi:hypothetical protein [Aurantibacter sp.]|uniref:hypothetical protein n=1 Tax=Aurantibacter sp. TaxID=2807103 RepID=UPI0035C8133A